MRAGDDVARGMGDAEGLRVTGHGGENQHDRDATVSSTILITLFSIEAHLLSVLHCGESRKKGHWGEMGPVVL